MRKRMTWIALFCTFAGLAMAEDSKPAAKHEEVHHFFESFGKALHKGDAKGVAGHFAENGLLISKDSGKQTEGRDAIAALYANVFKPGRVKSVELKVESVRQVTPDVAAVYVAATVTRKDGPVAHTLLHALLKKRDNVWQLDSIHEEQEASPPKPFETLQALAWMIGEWKDENGKLDIHTKCDWSDDHSFLTRTFTVTENGKKLHEGTQKIGFDAVDGVIRSWTFENDGSFGEGYWTFDGKDWTVTQRGRTAAGLNVSAKQIITPVDQNHYTTQSVSRELGGKLLPNGPTVKVVRVEKKK